MDDRLTRLLDLQRTVCNEVDVDPVELHREAETEMGYVENHRIYVTQRRDRLITWITCCVDELHEALDETNWKRHTRGERWDDEAMFGELRDALQFLVDLMFLATGLPAEKLADKLDEAMKAKSAVNLARARDGDDGVSRRCPRCRRSTDEPTGPFHVKCIPSWCAVYGEITVGQ